MSDRGLPGCAGPAAAALLAGTGRDIWAELGGVPADWREAAALYRRLGVRTLAEAVTTLLGPPVPARRACRGDLMLVDGSLGICRGELVECDGVSDGPVFLPIRAADRAWRI